MTSLNLPLRNHRLLNWPRLNNGTCTTFILLVHFISLPMGSIFQVLWLPQRVQSCIIEQSDLPRKWCMYCSRNLYYLRCDYRPVMFKYGNWLSLRYLSFRINHHIMSILRLFWKLTMMSVRCAAYKHCNISVAYIFLLLLGEWRTNFDVYLCAKIK